MKKNKKHPIIKLILFILILGLVTAFIDYERINNNKRPLFAYVTYNSKSSKQTFRGLFYVATRKITISQDESIKDSKNITYTFIKYKLKINKTITNSNKSMRIETTEEKKCTSSKLIYADLNIKIYTYCLDNIKILENNKEMNLEKYLKSGNNSYETILNKISFYGFSNDNISLEYLDNKNISNNGLKIIQCKNDDINDIYIGPSNMQIQPDFCTYKNDDFKFMWEVDDESEKDGNTCAEALETFYEDENNYYQFSCMKSSLVYIKIPAVRRTQEQLIPVKSALANNIVTIEDLKERGLVFNVVSKNSNLTDN